MSDIADRLAVALEGESRITVDLSPAEVVAVRFDVTFLASPELGDHQPSDEAHLAWRLEQKPSSA